MAEENKIENHHDADGYRFLIRWTELFRAAVIFSFCFSFFPREKKRVLSTAARSGRMQTRKKPEKKKEFPKAHGCDQRGRIKRRRRETLAPQFGSGRRFGRFVAFLLVLFVFNCLPHLGYRYRRVPTSRSKRVDFAVQLPHQCRFNRLPNSL